MSYVISITRNAIPEPGSAPIAWAYLDYVSKKNVSHPALDFIALLTLFTHSYPCRTQLPEDKQEECIWTDTPLLHNAGSDVSTLGIRSDYVDHVMPFLVKTATSLGFVVFDEQTGIISRPEKKKASGQVIKRFFNFLRFSSQAERYVESLVERKNVHGLPKPKFISKTEQWYWKNSIEALASVPNEFELSVDMPEVNRILHAFSEKQSKEIQSLRHSYKKLLIEFVQND